MSWVSNWRTTTFGSAVHDPVDFVTTLLDSLTYASLLLVVASGFTLIFGLMRVVNMAQGSFFLLAGYDATRTPERTNSRAFVAITSPVASSDRHIETAFAISCTAGVNDSVTSIPSRAGDLLIRKEQRKWHDP